MWTNTVVVTGAASGLMCVPTATVASSGLPISVTWPAPQRTALEWLDGEVERTCALARVP